MAAVASKGVEEEHGQCWNPALKPHVDASRPSAVGSAEAAISAWVAEERNRVSGHELSGEEAKFCGVSANAAKERELIAREKFELQSVEGRAPSKSTVDARLVLT